MAGEESLMTTYVLAILTKALPVPTPAAEALNAAENAEMAPIDIFRAVSYIPFVVTVSHQALIGSLSYVALHTIHRSYAALPPSSATRHRELLRKGYVQAFSILAFLSLASALIFGSKSASLSYMIWATERGVELPEGLFGDKGALRPGFHPGRIQVVNWLHDTSFYRDTVGIIAETARYAWWGQQIDISLVSWSMYLALEGQRRNISNLWAFLALSQLVNLSYAQNLFFLAVLLTPVPLPNNVRELTRSSVPATSGWYSRTLEKFFPTKPDGFLPATSLYVGLLFVNSVAVVLVPYTSNTLLFAPVALASRIVPFSFLLLPYLIPDSWGKIHTHPHSAHKTYITLFQTISVTSAALHLNSSAIALFKNTPDSTFYRRSLLHPFQEEHRSPLDRGTSAVGRVLGAISEHPVVTAVGIDVLLSGLTLGTWAGIRGLDAREMLVSAVPFMKPVAKEIEAVTSTAQEEAVKAIQKAEVKPARRRVGRPKKSETAEADDSSVSLPTRRGRSSKKPRDVVDPSYQPHEDVLEEGDEDAEEDWEAGALAWGLISAGGLGVGSAAVYGAEVLAR